MRVTLNIFLLSILVLITGGCASAEKEVQKVAKDWCMTIRGSQVIPVYPLTEDLQPGDVFLVQVPVDQQQRIYKQKGFLPLDNHIARLHPLGYSNFYSASFFSGTNAPILPREWIRPGTNEQSWAPAPRAAFPSYSFTVRNGAGLNLAVPVQGVPVGLGLLASDAASGSIEIGDAATMGVDTVSLYRELQRWVATNGDFVRHFGTAAKGPKRNFLRVVTRIYATGRMSVTLKDASNRSGGLDVGVPKPVNLLTPQLPANRTNTPETTLENYTNAFAVLQNIVQMASKAGPGGSLRLASASSSTVTLDETFNPPLLLGYLGFDCAVYRGGVLGPPIPTHAVLDPLFKMGALFDINPIAVQMLNVSIYQIAQMAANKGDKAAAELVRKLDQLDTFAPDTFTEYSFTPNNTTLTANPIPSGQKYPAYYAFAGSLDMSRKALEQALSANNFKLVEGAATTNVSKGSAEWTKLQRRLTYYSNLSNHLSSDPQIQDALSAAHTYYINTLLN